MNDALAASPRASLHDTGRRLGLAVVGAKLRATRNRFALTRRKSPVLTSLQLGIAVPAVVAFTVLLTIGFASAMSAADDDGAVVTMLGAMAALAAIGAFVGSSTSALQALYLADDIPFLLTLPIPLRALYASKLFEAAVGALPPAILSTAAVTAYGLVEAESPAYWLLAALAVISSTLTSTAFAVMTVSGVTRFIPPRRARLFLLAISLFIIAMTAVAWQALAPHPDTLNRAVGRSEYEPLRIALAWTPAGWSAEAMSAAADGAWGRALLLAAGVGGTAVATLMLSFYAFRRTFVRGLAQTQAVQTGTPSASLTRGLDRVAGLLPRRFGALVLKEWFVLFRDLRRLSGAIWPVGIVLMYTVLLGRGNGAFGNGEFAFWAKFGSLALLPWGLSLGISVYSYGSEGRNIQLLRALPYSAGRIFAAKVCASLLPVGTLSVGVAVITLRLRDAPLDRSLELLALLACMVFGFVTIDTAAASLAPNFETDQVQRTIGLTGRLASFALGSVFALAVLTAAARLVLFTVPPPSGMEELLALEAGGIAIFGWPIVILAAGTAASVVALAAALAVRQTDRILRAGV